MSAPHRKSSHRDLDGLAVVAALAMAGVAAWIGVVPTMENDEVMRRLTGQVTRSNEQLKGLQSEFRTVRSSIERAEKELARSDIELYNTEQLAARQGELHALFAGRGITVEQLIVGSISRGEQLDTVSLRLDGTGDFPTCIRVMHDLRAEFPDMAVTSFQISRTSAETSRGDTGAGQPGFEARFVFNIEWYAARSGRTGS